MCRTEEAKAQSLRSQGNSAFNSARFKQEVTRNAAIRPGVRLGFAPPSCPPPPKTSSLSQGRGGQRGGNGPALPKQGHLWVRLPKSSGWRGGSHSKGLPEQTAVREGGCLCVLPPPGVGKPGPRGKGGLNIQHECVYIIYIFIFIRVLFLQCFFEKFRHWGRGGSKDPPSKNSRLPPPLSEPRAAWILARKSAPSRNRQPGGYKPARS